MNKSSKDGYSAGNNKKLHESLYEVNRLISQAK